jgi:apolipoprotein N-acyltransferase
MSRLGWNRVLAAVASGAFLALLSPPLNLHWAAWFSLVPAFWALEDDDSAGNAALGYLVGYASVNGCFYWLAETVVRFSNLSGMFALFTLHTYSAVYALPYALVFGLVHPFRRRFGSFWIVLVPALQVASEYLTPALFPFYQGSPQYQAFWVWQLASVTGVYGVSYIVFLSNCALAEVVYRRREKRPFPWRPVAAVGSVLAANLAFGAWRTARLDALVENGRPLRVAMLQQSTTMEERLSETGRAALESWLDITSRIAGQPIDLLVWPEGACPYNPTEKNMYAVLSQMASEGNYNFLVGGGTRETTVDASTGKKTYNWYNSCYLFDRKGQIRDRYDKMIPLPFGEYLPFANVFPILNDWIQGPGNFRAGTRPTIFETDGYTFATPICYEAILPRVERKLAAADFFLNITNDAWFGTTAATLQHATLAAARAVEFGRPLLRVAYTGVNMVVEPQGRIIYQTVPFETRADVVTMKLAATDTIYRRFGDWFPICCLLGVLGASTVTLVSRARAARLGRQGEPGVAPPGM